jgi:urease accessory protein
VGARAIGITREDFVTPPEFQGLHLAEYAAGRLGGARIELTRVGDETRLGTCYQQIPIRLMPPFSFDSEPASLLYLINLTAGLMDGDGHRLEITARTGTRTVVTGQSATRVHPALSSFATQQWAVEVEDDACLVVLPGPTIPFCGCRYYQRGRVELAPRARLIWGDIWLPGRYDRGGLSERFQFERIVQDFEVRRAGRLVYRDRFRWDGPWTPEDADWYFGGHLASASLFVAGPMPDSSPGDDNPAIRRAVFRLDSGASCIRWCGHPSAVTADLVLTALRLAARWAVGSDAPPWLLASGSLAPNHWFSTPID